MFARKTGWNLASNRIAVAIEARRRARLEILDLSVTNPTMAGFDYPSAEIGRALAEAASQPYEPDPRGDRLARAAIARACSARGLTVDPDRIVLAASTSEAYAWLFKLLCDPGDRVMVPRPSYPLFEHLATLESVVAETYSLRYDDGWEIDAGALRGKLARNLAADSPAGAIVAVNPNNPTGSYLSAPEIAALTECAREHDLAIISDEVFSTFPLDGRGSERRGWARSFIGASAASAFVLDGLSKSAGMPGMKAAWIHVSGAESFCGSALSRLEMIADTYLSVGSPVQRALPRLIELGERVASQIRSRIRANHSWLRSLIGAGAPCELLRAEAGWSAVLRMPRVLSEEEWCLTLLERDGVIAHPGWFFDFESEAYLVASLLTPEAEFREGMARLLSRAQRISD